MSDVKIKTAEEIEIMRQAGKILQLVFAKLKNKARDGVSLLSLDKIAEKLIRSKNCLPGFKGLYGFPATLCTMINSEVVHGIPDQRTIKNGDLLSMDCGVIHKKMFADATLSLVVGGDKHNKKRAKFLHTCTEALHRGCSAAKSGNYTGDIGNAIEQYIVSHGYSICKNYTGHGLGYDLHEAPTIFNYGQKGTGEKLLTGMTLAIEPIVAMGNPAVKTLANKWTVVTKDGSDACQVEHCGVVTPAGLEIFA